MKSFKYVLLFLVCAGYFDLSSAIPAFARKYNLSCKTCHSPFPKLKDYGNEFAGNGFALPDREAPRYFRETGDNELSLIRELPIALRLEGYITYNNSKSEQTDFTAPYILKFLSGGEITKNIAYYFYFFFSERGDVAGIEDAFIMFNNVFGSELDVFVGQFQVSDPLFKRELRLTFDDYLIYKTKPGLSNIDLTYDRGLMFTYGFESGTDLTLEILNGSGIGGANNLRNFDSDKYKNFFGRIDQGINENLRIGAFGYWGKEKQGTPVNETTMFGPDVTVSVDNWELNVQYVFRNDDNPNFNFAAGSKIKTDGGFAELIFRPEGDNSIWYAAGLFNLVESDINLLNQRSATAHVGYMLRRNIRLVGEYTYNLTNEYGRIGVGFVTAF